MTLDDHLHLARYEYLPALRKAKIDLDQVSVAVIVDDETRFQEVLAAVRRYTSIRVEFIRKDATLASCRGRTRVLVLRDAQAVRAAELLDVLRRSLMRTKRAVKASSCASLMVSV